MAELATGREALTGKPLTNETGSEKAGEALVGALALGAGKALEAISGKFGRMNMASRRPGLPDAPLSRIQEKTVDVQKIAQKLPEGQLEVLEDLALEQGVLKEPLLGHVLNARVNLLKQLVHESGSGGNMEVGKAVRAALSEEDICAVRELNKDVVNTRARLGGESDNINLKYPVEEPAGNSD